MGYGLLLVHLLWPAMVAGQTGSASEYGLKAAMLYNLAHFVEWPASAYPDRRGPIVLCILGRDPFGSSLTSMDSSTPDTTVGAVFVRHLRDDGNAQGCHILYISTSRRNATQQILSTLTGSSVLTVGEMTQFAARGGMIQFSLEEQRVRFDINAEAASRAGLRISSHLLALARIVKD
jgi:hypothetical protein